MADFEARIGAMNLAAADLGALQEFYRNVFGIEPLVAAADEAIYRFGDLYLAFRLDPDHEAPRSGSAMRLAERGLGQLCVRVDDIDAASADLQSKGVELLGGPVNHPWGIRTLTFADPAGYLWEYVQDLPEND